MASDISIILASETGGRCLRISVPPAMDPPPVASIRNNQGSILKLVQLTVGSNEIDISNISENSLLVKVETTSETMLKNIVIN